MVLSDFGGGTWPALDAAREIRAAFPSVPILLLATDSSESSAIAALKIGVNDYLRHPVTPEQILESVAALLAPAAAPSGLDGNHRMVGESDAIRSAFAHATKVARTNSTVLIIGGNGHGQGSGCRADSCHEPSPKMSLRRTELRGDSGQPPRKRTVRERARRLHRSGYRLRRQAEARRRRHGAVRRNRRFDANHAAMATPSPVTVPPARAGAQ